jgi:predicted acetyltransferase
VTGRLVYFSLMPELIPPTSALHDAWLDARDDWGRGVHQDGSGLHTGDEVDTPAGFAACVRRLLAEADTAIPAGPGRVHATYFWIVEADTVLGSISLRHALNDFLLRAGGHVGYGIRPSARRRGLATWALGQVLPEARALGMDRLLVTCHDDNAGSARTIEKNGGVLEDVRATELGLTRRYWISL